jgi:hypothetical protein
MSSSCLVSGEKFPHLNIRAERFLSYFNQFLWAQGDCETKRKGTQEAQKAQDFEPLVLLVFFCTAVAWRNLQGMSPRRNYSAGPTKLFMWQKGQGRIGSFLQKSKSWWKTLKPFKRA